MNLSLLALPCSRFRLMQGEIYCLPYSRWAPVCKLYIFSKDMFTTVEVGSMGSYKLLIFHTIVTNWEDIAPWLSCVESCHATSKVECFDAIVATCIDLRTARGCACTSPTIPMRAMRFRTALSTDPRPTPNSILVAHPSQRRRRLLWLTPSNHSGLPSREL